MAFQAPERFNFADYLLDARVREGKGDRTAVLLDDALYTYKQVRELANRYANVLEKAGVEPEQRVLIALPDGVEYVAALLGIIKMGAAAVMVNPFLKASQIGYFYEYTRATVLLSHESVIANFRQAAENARFLKKTFDVASDEFRKEVDAASAEREPFPSHRDDTCLWLFSGGTTGEPKAVVQSHNSYANTTELYGKGTLQYSENDISLSVPKLFFGYATGSNLFFPFSVGATVALFPERCSEECLFEKVKKFKPTVLINVPTMINKLVNHPDAPKQDFSGIRVATSAGEALPESLYRKWKDTFGVEILDGLGTAEMWHIFISNQIGDVKPGTLGKVVPGFEVKVCDDDGNEVADGEVGWLWVRGNSRAIGYWQNIEKTAANFRGEWYISGDMIRKDKDGYITYGGRGDDMLKIAGKWFSPKEVENCLLQHDSVKEVAVVGVVNAEGLTLPKAFVVPSKKSDEETLKAHVKSKLETYKVPREIVFMDDFPRTHLGKVDRGKLRQS